MNKYKTALFVCAFVWGFGYVAMDHLMLTTNPLTAISLRFLLAGGLIFIFRFRQIKGKVKTNFTKIIILGLVLFLAFLFQTYGLAFTTTSKNAFLTATNVIWTPILISFFYKYNIPKNIKYGSSLMILGVALVSLDGVSRFNCGDVLTLIGAVFFAIHIILINRYATGDNVDTLVFGQLFSTGVLSLVATLLSAEIRLTLGSEFFISLLFVVVFSTALCFFLQNYGLSQIDSSIGAIILSFESMFGVIAAMLIDSERLTPIAFCGFVVMFLAILITERKA